MKTGKLPNSMLDKLIKTNITDSSVIVGPEIGMDGALLNIPKCQLVAVNDPITFETDRIGEYMVAVNANDIAVMGGVPQYLLAALMLPPSITETEINDIFCGLKSAAASFGISLIGGHTEVTDAVTRPVLSGTMLGKAVKKINPNGIKEGDSIIQINPIAIEGTVILASCHKDRLYKAGADNKLLSDAENLWNRYGLCIAKPAEICFKYDVRLMHDITEGGICGALNEMSQGAKADFAIDRGSIIIAPEAERLCSLLGLNVLGLIASGSLLAVVSAEDTNNLISELNSSGYEASKIGNVCLGSGKAFFTDNSQWPVILRDELAEFTE